MKDYPSHFADIEKEIEDELLLTHSTSVITSKKVYRRNEAGDYKITWFVDGCRAAFFTAHWDDTYEQWEGCWKVFNNDIKE